MKRSILAALLAAAVLVAGCFGSNKNPVKPPVEGPVYSQSTPQNTLRSLVIAYATRDSVEYAKLFAPDYQGASYDTDTLAGLQPGAITRTDEMAHIKRLADDPSIVRIVLDLGSSSSWVRQPAVGNQGETSWAGIAIGNPRLEIDAYWDSKVLPSGEIFQFTFSPETPAAGSPTDTLWTIVRWEESGP